MVTRGANEIARIVKELAYVKGIFLEVISLLPSFDITDEKVLPYGLRPHTRSVSWIVEQVIAQQTKYNASMLGLDSVEIDMPDTSLHDCVLLRKRSRAYVNIKITNSDKKSSSRNDIAAVEKLYFQYKANPNYRIVYAVFGFRFNNLTITFDTDSMHTFSPQFLPIYVNPRNDKIQAEYRADPEARTRQEFLTLLQNASQSIVLK